MGEHKRASLLLLLLLLASLPVDASSDEGASYSFADDVMMGQIEENVVSDLKKGTFNLKECIGKQSVEYVVRTEGNVHDTIPPILDSAAHDITVYVTRPSQSELRDYFSFPQTITYSNKDLAIGKAGNKAASKASVWLNESGMNFNWQLHASHPRLANKHLCIKVTQQSSTRPSLFYEELKQFKPFKDSSVLNRYYTNQKVMASEQKINSRKEIVYPFSSYLIVSSNVYLLSDGIGVTKCGYIQNLQGCETKFPFLGRNFNKNCKNILNKEIVPQGNSKDVVYLASLWGLFFERPKDVGDEKVSQRMGEIFETYCKQKGRQIKLTTKNNFTDHSIKHKSSVDKSYSTGLTPNIPIYDRVFVATTVWDHNYHHFTVDMLTRIIRYLPFLMANPDVKIQIRRTEMQFNNDDIITAGINLRKQYWKFLGIDENRFVDGPMLAVVAYIPRYHTCNHYFEVGIDLHLLVNHLKAKANDKVSTDRTAEILRSYLNRMPKSDPNKPIMALIHRVCHSVDHCLKSWREFSEDLFVRQYKAFHDEFSSKYNLIILRQDDTKLSRCIACQINLFSKVDVLIATHGAGITNIMYMKPGAVLVEIVGKFDGRMLPVCGYHGPLASLFGIHHTIYYYDWMESPVDHKELNFKALVRQTKEFIGFIQTGS